MAKTKKSTALDDVKLELTPMIDVTFLLLIFFICTMKFKVLEGKLETQLPKDVGVNSSPVQDMLEKVEVDVVLDPSRPSGVKVAINGLVVPNLDTFRGKMATYVQNDPETRCTIYPRDGVTYAHVVQVVDQLLRVKLTDITFAGVAFDA